MRIDLIGSVPTPCRRILAVFPAFPEAERMPAPRYGLMKRMFLTCVGAERRRLIVQNDQAMTAYFANPRPPEYRIAAFRALLYSIAPSAEVRVVADASMQDAIARDGGFANAVLAEDRPALIAALRHSLVDPHPDAVVLCYPDALGLGQENLEATAGDRIPTIILNGRRRAFVVTDTDRAFLKARRREAIARNAEPLFVSAAFLVGAVGDVVDNMFGRGDARGR